MNQLIKSKIINNSGVMKIKATTHGSHHITIRLDASKSLASQHLLAASMLVNQFLPRSSYKLHSAWVDFDSTNEAIHIVQILHSGVIAENNIDCVAQ